MSRPIFLGNGSMMVGLNHHGFVHDLYYPYVGLENHASSRDLHHRIGVWVDDKFSWLDEDIWTITLNYESTGMFSITRAVCLREQLALEFHDFVDSELNVFCRNIHVINNAKVRRDIRVFMHQVFRISDSNRDDTAQYIPQHNVIIHYRGQRVFLVGGEHPDGSSFDQYSIGLYGIEGHEGTYRDAEDGELSGHSVEHGRVDSVIRFSLTIDPVSSSRIKYWLSATASQKEAFKNHNLFRAEGFMKHFDSTSIYWQNWLSGASNKLHQIDKEFHKDVIKSLWIIKSHIDRRGAVIASGDSHMLNYARDYYSYCWPRDAAFVLWPLIRLGFQDEPRAFFEFARDVLHADGYLNHKFQSDRSIGSSWHPYLNNGHEELPIQEDETAIVIFLLGEYHKASKDDDFVIGMYEGFIQPAANFIDSYIDSDTKLPHASYDLWEQKFLTTTYTTAVVYASLIAAAEMAEKFEYPDDAIRWRTVADDIRQASQEVFINRETGYFNKGFLLQNGMLEFDTTIDASSLYGAVMFGLYDSKDEFVKKSVTTLENVLVDKTPSGGIPRYEHDDYYIADHKSLGNPWIVTTLWYAQYLLTLGDKDRAKEILRWTHSKMLPSGVLPEQINPNTSEHISVAPLIWSQAEFISTILDL